MEKKTKTTRVQLELAERSFDRLAALKEKTEASSYTEVVRNALRLYENLIEQHDAGKHFFLKDNSGNITEYELFV
jgi:IS1 family transposase